MRTFYHRHARNCCCPLHVGSLRRRPIAVNQPWVSAGGSRRRPLPLAAAFSISPRLSRPARGPRASPLHASPPASHILRCDPRAPRCLSPAVTSLTSCPACSLLSTLPQLQWSPLLLGHPRDVPASAPFPSLLPLPAVRCPPRLHGPPHCSGAHPYLREPSPAPPTLPGRLACFSFSTFTHITIEHIFYFPCLFAVFPRKMCDG